MGGCTLFMADAQFFRADAQFFAAGLLWPINYAFCCYWTTFTLEMMVLCSMQPCLPLTEHVQTLFTLNWACANSVLGMCRHNWPCLTLFLTVLIDNYDWNLTLSQTQTHWVYRLQWTTRLQESTIIRTHSDAKTGLYQRLVWFLAPPEDNTISRIHRLIKAKLACRYEFLYWKPCGSLI